MRTDSCWGATDLTIRDGPLDVRVEGVEIVPDERNGFWSVKDDTKTIISVDLEQRIQRYRQGLFTCWNHGIQQVCHGNICVGAAVYIIQTTARDLVEELVLPPKEIPISYYFETLSDC